LQVMLEAAQSKSWQVLGGQENLVTLQSGLFVEGNLERLGAAAAAYIQRSMPIFKVPWRIKLALEDAKIKDCRVLSPDLIR
jgi:hypothetical protein